MHLITVNHQVTDGRFGVGTVYRNAKRVGATTRSIPSIERLFNVMDVVLQQFYMRPRAHNADAQWSKPAVRGAVVTNFKAFDPDVTLVMNREYGASAIWNKMPGVKDGRLAGVAAKGNVSIGRVAGCL